jgi:ribulose-bisphosphate carboxylase large chain
MFEVPGKGCEVLPVVASGQTARQAPATYAALGTTDLLFAAGGGIMAHPGGIAAGVRSLHQAWQAAVEGVPLEAHAAAHDELRQALERFKP